MPSSNFLRRRWLTYLVLAVVLGAVSPMLVQFFDFTEPASRHGLLYWWFMGIPSGVDMLLWPSQSWQYLLWAMVFTAMYLSVFLACGLGVMLAQRKRRPRFQQSASAFDTAATLYAMRDTW